MKKLKLLLLLGIVLSCSSCIFSDEDPTKVIKTIELKNERCKIYLKHVVWGMTADNSITYISRNADLADTIREPYFRVLDFFYKLDEECMLHIYESDSLHRSKFSDVKIIVHKERTIDYTNYKKEGFDNIIYN